MQSYNVSKFTFNDGTYSAEASDLGWPPGSYPTELGITHRSGVVQRFALCGVSFGPNKDLDYYKFQSVLGKQQVLVFND